MPRAYVQPKSIIKSLQYMNPNDEVLATTKNLTDIDSPLQRLDPGNNTYHIVLPDPIDCNGMIFYIMNASAGVGVLNIYDNTNTISLLSIDPNKMAQFNCISNEWFHYSMM